MFDFVDQLAEAAGVRSHHVPGDVEAVVVDPDRRVQPQRHIAQSLAEPRRAPKAARDVLAQLLEAGRPAIHRRLEHRGPADVHVGRGRFHGEKRSVEWREPQAHPRSPRARTRIPKPFVFPGRRRP
jgi:hypothetical protein